MGPAQRGDPQGWVPFELDFGPTEAAVGLAFGYDSADLGHYDAGCAVFRIMGPYQGTFTLHAGEYSVVANVSTPDQADRFLPIEAQKLNTDCNGRVETKILK